MLDELAPPLRAARSSAAGRADRAVLAALAEVSEAFTRAGQLDPVLDRLLGTVLEIVCADAGSIMVLSGERDTLVVVAARGPRARAILGTGQSADLSSAGWPLTIAGRVVGVISAILEPGAPGIDDHAAHLLELLANQAAILIDSVQMLEELHRKEQRLEHLVDQLLGETSRRPAQSIALLTPLTRREQQVLELLVDGLTNREIALRLVVEPDTIKDHVQSIIKKLGATDRTHAAVIAVRGGIVS